MYCGIEIIEIKYVKLNIGSHLIKYDDFLFSHKNIRIPNPISPDRLWLIVELLRQLYIIHGKGQMSHDKRRIGDNQHPIEEAAIKLVRNIYKALIVQNGYATQAYTGKNKTIRDNNAQMSVFQSWKMLNDLKPWYKVIEAKENGVDIDSSPIKSSKLEIVAGSNYKFGQYIIDGEIVPPLFEEDDHDQG